MAAADVRDMLDLPAEGQQQSRPHKKQKVVEKRPGSLTLLTGKIIHANWYIRRYHS